MVMIEFQIPGPGFLQNGISSAFFVSAVRE